MRFWDGILEVSARLDDASHYDLLGVEPSSTPDQIADRYRALADKLNPARVPTGDDPGHRDALNRVHSRLEEAHRVLTNPSLRQRYDQTLRDNAVGLGSANMPTHPLARKLLAEAEDLIAAGDLAKAQSTLELAAHYDQNCPAIAAALGRARGDSPAAAGSGDVPVGELLATSLEHAPPPPGPGRSAPPPVPKPPPIPGAPSVSFRRPATPAPARVPNGSSTYETLSDPLSGHRAEGKSRRRHARSVATLPVRLTISSEERLRIVYSRNISQGGIFLATDKPAPEGTPLRLTLVAPSGDSIALRGTVARTTPPGAGERPGMGIRFDRIDTDTDARLRALVGNVEDEASAPPPGVDDLVSELVRLRGLSPREVLGVTRSDDRAAVDAAYKRLAKRYHPARAAGGDSVHEQLLREVFEVVRTAFEKLGS